MLMIVVNGYDFDSSSIHWLEIYTNVDTNNHKVKIEQCLERKYELNRKLEKIIDLSDELSWSDDAIEYELRKSPEFRNIDADDLEDVRVDCKLADVRRIHE